ncbi:tumor protein p53 inducible nuclear protein [Rhynchophorus ferrugineus]
MLQSLANFLLFGGDTTGGVNNGDDTTRVALRTTDHDDGWTLVDRDSEGGSDGYSSEEDDNVDEDGMERVRLGRTSSSESLSRGHNRAMDESWFITPPPCFSSQSGPVQLRTSPLENLLIEHPSMSVYLRTGNRHPQQRSPTPSDIADDVLETEEEVVVEEEEEVINDQDRPQTIVVVRRAAAPPANPHRCNRAQALQLSARQQAKNLQAQKVQMKKLAKQAARGFLSRSNKAREANGRNWNPRRKERCQGSARSHANNNRKC